MALWFSHSRPGSLASLLLLLFVACRPSVAPPPSIAPAGDATADSQPVGEALPRSPAAPADAIISKPASGHGPSLADLEFEPTAVDVAAVTDSTTSWVGPRTLTVAAGIHVLGELTPSAVYVVETGDGVVLIDSGVEESCQQLLDGLRELSIDPQSIRYVLLTHAHYDHVFGASRLRQIAGAKVCAGRADSNVLRSADLRAMFSVFSPTQYSGNPIPVDRELEDGDKIVLGGVEITAIASPGHTHGSTCYALKKDGQRILFAGDVVASLNFGPATYAAYLSPRYRGDAAKYLETIQKFLAGEPPDILLPGHPLQHRRAMNVCIDEHRWRELLEPAARELQLAVERRRQDGADFLDDVPKELLPGVFYLGTISDTAVYGVVTPRDFVLFNAPGGAQFGKFIKSRLAQLGVRTRQPTAVVLTSSAPRLCSGLGSLSSGTSIIVSHPSDELVKRFGMKAVVPWERLAEYVSFPVQAINVKGSPQAEAAFSFRWQQKNLLITSSLISQVALVWKDRLSGQKTYGPLQLQRDRLLATLLAPKGDPHGFIRTLKQLEDLSIDLWMPTQPAWGQNANLYDDEWTTVLATNIAIARRATR